MRLLHKVVISVFLKPEQTLTESEMELRIVECMKKLSAIDIEHEKIQIATQTVSGFNERKIKIFTLILEKENHTNIFLKHLRQNLSHDQTELLLQQKESRLDENLDFFIRLGFDEMLRNSYQLTDSGDCFHIRMVIAAFPKTRNAALEVIEKIFNKKI